MNVLWTYISPTRISQPARLRGKAAEHLEATRKARLTRIFAAWKAVLLIVALTSPGPGYDTSTQILFDRHRGLHQSRLAHATEHLALRLTRWDGIYFASASAHGKVYEQEWAFSWTMSKITSVTSRVFFLLPVSDITKHALTGVLLSHLSHLLAVFVLYSLVFLITPATETRKRQLAFTTACLYILSPAGVFLSAPFAESTFALFNFLGLLCYSHAVENRLSTFADAYQLDACWTLGAGVCFGVATMIRSNGILSGVIFAWDAVAMSPRLINVLRTRDREQLTRFLSVVLAGGVLAMFYATPQAVAWMEYCRPFTVRPWCKAVPPSIYTFVQSHYWNVGPFRYWTISNLPLFALVFPLGWVMVETTIPALFQAHHVNRILNGSTVADQRPQPYPPVPHTKEERVFVHLLPRFAISQLLLVAMAAIGFHVQILMRISSGYPIWYFIMAVEISVRSWHATERNRGSKEVQGDQEKGDWKHALFRLFNNFDRIPSAAPEVVVRAMVIYAIVQAGLYASFLPPA